MNKRLDCLDRAKMVLSVTRKQSLVLAFGVVALNVMDYYLTIYWARILGSQFEGNFLVRPYLFTWQLAVVKLILANGFILFLAWYATRHGKAHYVFAIVMAVILLFYARVVSDNLYIVTVLKLTGR